MAVLSPVEPALAPLARSGRADVWRGAASARVAQVVLGPARDGTVLAVFPSCVYVRLEQHADVIAVLTRDAVDLPIGIRVPESADELGRGGLWSARPGDQVVVGAGRVAFPAVEVVVARTRAAATHRLPRFPIESAELSIESAGFSIERARFSIERAAFSIESALPSADGDLLAASRDVALQALRAHETSSVVARLVGAGRGLTPSGDDALCGMLLALRALGRRDAHAAVATATRARLRTTTSLSAALLVAAADGWAAPPVVRVLARLARAPRWHPLNPEDRDVQDVLAIGHTSGADLLTGVVATLNAVAATPTAAPHPHNHQGAPRG